MHWFDLWKACVMYVQVNLTTVYFCCSAIFHVFCIRTITSVLRYSFNVCVTSARVTVEVDSLISVVAHEIHAWLCCVGFHSRI